MIASRILARKGINTALQLNANEPPLVYGIYASQDTATHTIWLP